MCSGLYILGFAVVMLWVAVVHQVLREVGV